MNDTTPKANYFVRAGVIAVVLYIAAIVVASFRFGPSPFAITSGIIVLLTMLILLVLAEAFNSITFGSILRLKRDVAKAEEDKKEAKTEVKELRASLLTLATNVHQSQVTTNISGMDVATLRRVLGVVEATPEEKETEKEPEEEKAPVGGMTGTSPTRQGLPTDFESRRRLRKNVEEELFRRFSTKYGIPLAEIRREVKFEAGLEMIDPIMDRNIIYDGYVRSATKEYFLEVVQFSSMNGSLMISDRLYVPLAKVFFYRQLKKVDAEMVLLYPIFPTSAEEQKRDPIARILQWFQPAISNNLLRVEGFSFTEEQYDELKKK